MMAQKLIDQPKAPESKPGAQPDSKDDLKSLPLAEVEKKLGSSPDGLSQAEAQKRLAQYHSIHHRAAMDPGRELVRRHGLGQSDPPSSERRAAV